MGETGSQWKKIFLVVFFASLIGAIFAIFGPSALKKQTGRTDRGPDGQLDDWKPPVLTWDTLTSNKTINMIVYGYKLIKNTSRYFGPSGTITKYGNGMNCQNCHLESGTKPWGNNYSAVASTYPKFRPRSGRTEDISKRVNDCFERSLNAKAIDTMGYEMRSIVSFIKWLGQNVKKGLRPKGSGIIDLDYMDRAANPAKGQAVYIQKCQSCHQADGKGIRDAAAIGYTYPPLWGKNSYNTGAGLFRLSRFAGFVRDNMPFNQASHQRPVLTVEEAWDVSAFVNSQPRPIANLDKDWPDIATKPVDHPFSPYSDSFSEHQHKYGPFKPIETKKKAKR